MQVKRTYNKKIGLTSSSFFAFLVVLFWTKDTVLSFVIVALSRIPIIGSVSLFISPLLFIVLLLLALPYILKNIHFGDCVFVCSIALLVLFSDVFFEQNSPYINEQLWRIIGLSIPLYFVGISFNPQVIKRSLYYASVASIVVMFLYQIYYLKSGRELNSDNMDAAYNVLPSVMYLFCHSFENHKFHDGFFSAVGLVLLFIFGTRGAILSCVLFAIVNIVIKIFAEKNFFKKGSIILVCFIGMSILCVGNNMLNIAKFLATKFEALGFSTRVFDFVIQGNLKYSSGRDILQEKIWEAIMLNPFGYGCMGDRPIINTYSHNIILEMLCSYGVVFGTIILGFLLCLIVLGLYRARGTDLFRSLLLFTIMVLTKLMLSGSYIVEPYFFFLIGLCVRSIRTNRKRVYGYENCSN